MVVDSNEHCLTELPFDVLIRIAAVVSSTPNDALHLSETSMVLRTAVSVARRYRLTLSGGKDAARWAALHAETTRHMTVDFPFATDHSLQPAYDVLRYATALESASVRASPLCLRLLATQEGLKSLSLQVSTALMHNKVVDAVGKLSNLNHLRLSYSLDYSLIDVPHAQRCACYPLRRDPARLTMVGPRIVSFELYCRCAAADRCTIPPFPALESATLGGALQSCAPPTLAAIAPTLKTLTLADPDTSRAIALADSVNPAVTAILTGEGLPRPLGPRQLHDISHACPNIQTLCILLHPDTEARLTDLPQTLQELRISFRAREIGYGDGVQFHPFVEGVLKDLAISAPLLKILCISSSRLDPKELEGFLSITGDRLTKLSLPVHAQGDRPDARLSFVLEKVVKFCTVLEHFDIQPLPQISLSTHKPKILQDKTAILRLNRAYGKMRRQMPFMNVGITEDVVTSLVPSE